MNKKSIAVLLAVLLVVGVAIGGTMAWLTSTPEPVKNVFTAGDVDITLTEKAGGENKEFQMIPGWTIEKDPTVTVAADSEPCWLFVKVEKSTNAKFDNYMTYAIAEGWTVLENAAENADVYYRKVADPKVIPDAGLAVLKDNQVLVKETVTKEMMNNLTPTNYPTLTFTAYAIQLKQSNEQEFTPAEAWAAVQPTN